MVLFNMISKSTFFRDLILDYKALILISRKESIVREARGDTRIFYIYYMFWLILQVFFPLIPNPLSAKRYLLSILRKSKMAAINNPFFGNVLETPLIIRNWCFWCLYFGFGGQRIQRIGFGFSILSIMSKSKMAAIKKPFPRNALKSFRINTSQSF